ncbi:MAG: ATP-binding protein [Solirubrobacterales bacterium]|nr:ATP-binding protein [Solirubrobacterales bacterium]OJU94353.1 MAG: AAA+ family ATPase [Solirubrobacterales bacterium 67-14]
MPKYLPRLVDLELDQRLTSSGAVLIDGPKGCGKTETATQRANSVVRFDTDAAARAQVDLDPSGLFEEPIPILFDEWQRAPQIWDHVRRHVDDLRRRGLYILTGSATPTDSQELHSGAGRISTLRMRPMSLFESGHSTGEVSLAALLRGEDQRAKLTKVTVPELMTRIVTGGWPTLVGENETFARQWLADYLQQIVEVDIPSLGTTRRAPERLRRTLTSLARSVGQPVKISELAKDIAGSDDPKPARETVSAYLDALDRLKLTENSPSWRPHMRSRTQLRDAPVRYFVDPSIGTAALGVGSKDLLADPNAAGFQFESLVLRDLRVYAQPLRATISTWREVHGRKEVDAIVETPDSWVAVEVKLTGDQKVIDDAARGLLDFASEIDTKHHRDPASLVVVTAMGGGGKRADGVHVVPITALGP